MVVRGKLATVICGGEERERGGGERVNEREREKGIKGGQGKWEVEEMFAKLIIYIYRGAAELEESRAADRERSFRLVDCVA